MVKNTIGGKKGKMLSKKQHSTNNSSFPVSMDEQEIYVCVLKVFGGGVFEVMDKNEVKYKAYLRGKMKGSNKRHNLVSMNSILLVGLRSDVSDKSSVDILFVYDNHHIQTLSLNSHFPICLLSYIQGNNNGQMKMKMKIDTKRDIDNIFLSFEEEHSYSNSYSNSNSNSNSNEIGPNYNQKNGVIFHQKNTDTETEIPTETEFDFDLI